MKRIQVILIWMIGISFIAIGILKYVYLDDLSTSSAFLDELSESIFERANYPKWFFYVVATLEFVGGLLLLMTAATSKRLGSIMIGVIMLGAICTHYILDDHYTHFILPGIIFTLSVFMSLDFEQKKT